MHYRRLLCIIIALSFSLSAQAFEGKVVSIADGDTISVMHDGVAEKIRLNGVDCPESGQAFGNKAKQFTGDMVFGKIVNVKEYGKDKYGRTIGDVFLPDGKNLNKELIKAGFAWWYRKYSNDNELKQLEQEAKLSKRGLWTDSNPVAPWDWRHNPNAFGKSTLNKSVTKQVPSAENQVDTVVYITKTGSKYHNAGCRYLKSSVPIKLSEISSGYSPCSVCNPPIFNKNVSNQESSKQTPINNISSDFQKTVSEKNSSSSTDITGIPTGETTPRGFEIYEGPRGGRYHYSKSGKKVYEKKR